MALTNKDLSSVEEDVPSDNNIFTKTFQICERMDSDASVIFTDMNDDAGAFAATQQETLDSFSLSEGSTPTTSPQKPDSAYDLETAAKADRAGGESPRSPRCSPAGPSADGSLPHKLQASRRQPEEKARDSIADDAMSILSTTAVDGSIASAASNEGSKTLAQISEGLPKAEAALEVHVNGFLDDGMEQEDTQHPKGKDPSVEHGALEVGPQELAKAASEEEHPAPPAQESPSTHSRASAPDHVSQHDGEASTANPMDASPAKSQGKVDSKPDALVAATRDEEHIPGTVESQQGRGPAQASQQAPAQSSETAAPEAAGGAKTQPLAAEGSKGSEELFLLTPGRQGEERAGPSGSSAGTPEDKPAAAVGVSSSTVDSLPPNTDYSLPELDGPHTQDILSLGADSPPTPETTTPGQSKQGRSSQDSDGPRTSTSSGRSKGLNPVSQPFVPSTHKIPAPEGTFGSVKTTSAKPLNAKATAFVPSAQAATSSGPDSSIFPSLQFGDLPESLNASPHPSNKGQMEWETQYNNYSHTHMTEGDWQAGWNEYDYSGGYDDAGYRHAEDGYHTQGEDEWKYWEAAQEGHENGWGGEAETLDAVYQQDELGDEDYNNFLIRRAKARGPRARRRIFRNVLTAPRNSWAVSVVDVLTEQFGFHRASIREMLDLHEGNVEVVLDMLAQLEAEKEGLLPASSQDAPELNEENFPSLGSSTAQTSQQATRPKGDFAAAVRAPTNPSAAPTPQSKRAQSQPAPQAKPARDQLAWVETGAPVSNLYDSARAAARDHARLRNQYFQEATKAYMVGDKALARQLSLKGKEESELMKAAHISASQAIYKHRNPVSGSKGKPGLVDLHGLHVKEAIAILEEQIEAVRRSKPKASRPLPQRLSVLVGTGHHTKGLKTPARLPPAIEEYLKASQITYTALEPGVLDVTI